MPVRSSNKGTTDEYLPTLDFQLKLELPNDGPALVRYKFYKKPMCSKIAILQNSAMPDNTKNNTITQETIRRTSNTDWNQPDSVRISTLLEYIEELSSSGYSHEEIERAMTPGIVGIERRRERELADGAPAHRLGATITKQTAAKKLTLSSSWYKKSPLHEIKTSPAQTTYKKHQNCQQKITPSAPPVYPQNPWGGTSKET